MCPFPLFVVLLLGGVTLCGCASKGFSPESWKFPIDGKVTSISRAGLGEAIAAANADRIWRVHIIDRNHVRVDISDDWHRGPDYEHLGRSVRFHGEPAYVIVTRVAGKWESGGATVTTY